MADNNVPCTAEELAEFRKVMEASFRSDPRRFRRPVSPGPIMAEIMEHQDLSNEGVAQKTGLSQNEVAELLDGKLSFAKPDVVSKLQKWLEESVEILRNLEESRDYFDAHGERRLPVFTTPDPRTLRMVIGHRKPPDFAAAP